MSRKKRKVKKSIKLLVEGETEKHYLDGLKNALSINFSIQTVNMKGGGYANFLRKLKKEDNLGFIAFFIFIDLDKAHTDRENLKELIKYCNQENKKSNIPYLLVGTNKDFEFFACCHCPKYNYRDTGKYIKNSFSYASVDKFKSDTKIFDFLNKNGRTYNTALEYLKPLGGYFSHDYKIVKRELDITIKLLKKSVIINEEKLNINHSNIWEFFDIILDGND